MIEFLENFIQPLAEGEGNVAEFFRAFRQFLVERGANPDVDSPITFLEFLQGKSIIKIIDLH